MQGSSGRAEIQKEVLATVENRINLVRRWKRKILLGPDVIDALSVKKPIEWYLGSIVMVRVWTWIFVRLVRDPRGGQP